MARTRNDKTYNASYDRLIDTGLALFRRNGFEATGIGEILTETGLPKGSFYHYFASKEAYGLAVAEEYHQSQMAFANGILSDQTKAELDRLKQFFRAAHTVFESLEFSEGCLMCNLSNELGTQNDNFQSALSRFWRELSAEIEVCLTDKVRDELGLAHLSPQEGADALLNGWSGALTRMKAERSEAPLKLFMKTMIKDFTLS
ncbi:TetR/AcrR family transcriptional regulator [Ponticaulis sp.]|uniref:TetR/AcrR family transcriptional regulator n=1 Tax=Ponticaulis sp. TaxID=2020902 RepID=UPI000B751D19|nr:TetR/AcrR family transcriptional regulator [Ponticaulis sp.]MAI90127.1 TetR family transcriptional regulator [Ponticaulis sp.]OUX99781.1 MAG: TetR family transcriptional regulator [Hyphomonadaceae bacterium TMED5]|tara:strand:- start:86519 stop:87124 length:606 start_codon:yes stop_codon:yes gene_type:complete